MENNKWEQIANQIRQYIDTKSFGKAFQLLKKSAIEKQNFQLQQELADVKKAFDIFKKKKKQGVLTQQEIQAQEQELAEALSYFSVCLQVGGASSAVVEPSASSAQGESIDDVEIPLNNKDSDLSPLGSGTTHIENVIDLPPSPILLPIQKSIEIVVQPIKKMAKPPKKQQSEGGILYNIPNKMQLGIQTKCVVRLAFDKNQLKKSTDKFDAEVIKTARVSDVMEVDLIDISGENAFNIQFVSQKEQFIDKNEATEWLIMVKPQKIGSFSLALKVAIIEKIEGKDRRKEMVLEELVAVVTDGIEPTTTFKVAEKSFQPIAVQTLLPTDSPSVKTVLFMGANPPGTQFLQLEIEHSRISVELEGKFRFPTAKFLSASEIPKLFIIHKPNIVHFSGHGKNPSVNIDENGTRGIGFPKNYEKTGGIIVFDNEMRGMKVIEDRALEIVFTNAVQKLNIPIEVVIFNSCHSESQAKVVGKSVPYVVGTAHAIKDEIAISFAVGFYFGLSNGLSVENAFINGKSTAVLEDLDADGLIVLYKNGEKMNL